jgi:hypothetical protein
LRRRNLYPRWAGVRLGASVLAGLLLVSACDDDYSTAPPPPGPTPTVSGIVTSAATGDPVFGAQVSIGVRTVTTGVDGRFELSQLTPGSAVLRCSAAGFQDSEANLTVSSGSLTQNVSLTRIELHDMGDFVLFVPATVSTVRGILLALGGPDTRGFASGAPFGAPVPETEAALQTLGQQYRTLAAEQGLAVLGTSLTAMVNDPGGDEELFIWLAYLAEFSGRRELNTAPLLLYGMSGGAPYASGFAARHPDRVAGLFLKVPEAVESLTDADALGVPTYAVQAEFEVFVDNAAVAVAFAGNRGAGALWALAMEPGVNHFSLTPGQRAVTINWMQTILELRLGAPGQSSLLAIDETAGWLADPATGEVAPWAAYTGDPAAASWFPSQATAEYWEAFVGIGFPGSSGD